MFATRVRDDQVLQKVRGIQVEAASELFFVWSSRFECSQGRAQNGFRGRFIPVWV